MNERANIIAALQKDILLMSGYKPADHNDNSQVLSLISDAFPNNTFPIAAVHEFICHNQPDLAATAGFIASVISVLPANGIIAWAGRCPLIFPPALKQYGIDPSRVLFLNALTHADIFYLAEEALKCEGITTLIGELDALSLTESRRLQLAVEKRYATAFIIRHRPRSVSTVSLARWAISPLPSGNEGLPGVQFPRWDVRLQKIRNGKPGNWQMEWSGKQLRLITPTIEEVTTKLKKVV